MSAARRLTSEAGHSKFKAGVWAAAVLLAAGWYCLLFSFRAENKASSSGELLLNGSGAAEQVKGSPVMAALVDYFGAYLYLVPLILVYLGYVFYKTPMRLRNLDLFKAGLFFLGFDLSALGICTLLSASSDAGGILGDFFAMYLGTAFSPALSVLIAMGAALGGICLMGGQTLLNAAEALGAKICSVIFKDEKDEDKSNAPKSKDEKSKTRFGTLKLKDLIAGKKNADADAAAGQPKDGGQGEGDVQDELYDSVASAFNLKNGYKNEARHEKREPNFGDVPRQDGKAQNFAPGLSATDAGEPIRSGPHFAQETGSYAGSASGDYAAKEGVQESGAPAFSSSSFTRNQPRFTPDDREDLTGAGRYPYQESRNQGAGAASALGAEALTQGHSSAEQPDLRPGSFVSYAQANQAGSNSSLDPFLGHENAGGYPRAGDAREDFAKDLQDENQGPSTIINDSRQQAAPQEPAPKAPPQEQGAATHIFRSPKQEVPQAPQSIEDDDPNAVRTIITHQEAQAQVALPPEDDGVATLITHHVPDPAPQEEAEPDNEVHSYIFRNEGTKVSDLNAEPEKLDFVPGHQVGKDPNVIDFNDYQAAAPSFEVEGSVQGLTPHSAVDNKIYGEDAPLRPHSRYISEKDLPSSYREASRGVFETDKNSLSEIKKRIEQSISTSDDDSIKEQEEKLKEGLAAVEREIRAAQENFGGQVKALTAPRGQDESQEPSQAQPDPASFAGSATQGLTPAQQASSVLSQSAQDVDQSSQALPAPLPSTSPVQPQVAQGGYMMQGTQNALGTQSLTGDSLPESRGFLGGAHNSSSSKLPSYVTPSEQSSQQGSSLRRVTLSNVTTPQRTAGSWRPPLDILKTSHEDSTVPAADLERMAKSIDQFLQSFKVQGRVESYVSGPVVTRYDIRLDPGVSSSKINSLSLDMCRALLVASVRVIEVIPNTPYVGVEVPNEHRKIIYLGNILRSDEFMHSKALLPIMMGVSITGRPLVADLAKAPHLLICGTTGSGKSVGLHSLIVSLIMKLSPEELRLVLIDPKRVEFSLYQDLPHLITPVISDVDKAAPALRWCVEEMERRYRLLELMNVRNIADYNRCITEAEERGEVVYDPAWSPEMGGTPPVLKRVPMLVIAVEEYADLMLQSKGSKKNDLSSENCINRLAAKARAAGIHLILATQSPRSDVITGVIRSNIPSRLAFTVQANVDSRLIIEESGAEKLLGYGDMLVKFLGFQNGQLFRAHGPLVENSEIMHITQEWRAHYGDPEYIEGVSDIEPEENELEELPGAGQLDKLFDHAAAYARDYFERKHKNPSISDFQTNLGVGYPRAKKIYGQLVREGVLND